MRILVDANVIVSALAFPGSVPVRALDQLMRDHTVVVSDLILREVERVLDVKFPQVLPLWRALLTEDRFERVPVPEDAVAPAILRDPKDVHVLLASLQPGIDGLLTGDQDFNTPQLRQVLRVWSPAAMLLEISDD